MFKVFKALRYILCSSESSDLTTSSSPNNLKRLSFLSCLSLFFESGLGSAQRARSGQAQKTLQPRRSYVRAQKQSQWNQQQLQKPPHRKRRQQLQKATYRSTSERCTAADLLPVSPTFLRKAMFSCQIRRTRCSGVRAAEHLQVISGLMF